MAQRKRKSGLHIFTANWQPLTRFRDADGRIIHFRPRSLHLCRNCRKRRTARKLKIQAYYDQWIVWCKDGCKA